MAQHAPALPKIACVGGGVIGAGWAARFLLEGHDVIVIDSNAAGEAHLQDTLNAARRAARKITLAPAPAEGKLLFTGDFAALADNVDFVQESLPEQTALKQKIYGEIEKHIAPDTPIMSSTSGLRPSELQANMQNPQRFGVAHPFNPVYLLPLVELCAGDKTSASVIQRSRALYESVGMQALVLKKEIDGFVADRMMEALWREALWLVHDDIADAGEIDDAIRLGCGLRWAFMGPFLTYRLGGGEGGMRHFMAQFAPTLALPWTKLMDVPKMDDALLDKIVRQSDAQAQGKSIPELYQMRDDCLVGIIQALKQHDTGAGAALKRYENERYQKVHAPGIDLAAAPLALHRTRVSPEWIDYNGHLTESRYLQVFGDTTDAFLHAVGIDTAYVAEHGSFYTVETHICHLGQGFEGDTLELTTQLLAKDAKRVHLFHTMRRGEDTIATAEHLLLYVKNDRAAPCPPAIAEKIDAIWKRHRDLPAPEKQGRTIGI